MPSQILETEVPYKAFSGANIIATIGHRKVGNLQAVTCSITREVAALYSFGDANPKAFVKGKRGIAGSLVFTQFDRHALLQDIFKPAYEKRLDQTNGLFSSRYMDFRSGDLQHGGSLLSRDAFSTRNFIAKPGDGARVQFPNGAVDDVAEDLRNELADVYELVASQRLRYHDQIPEFDITVTMINESGDAAFATIGGVILVNEGWGYTLDDLTSEVAYTYVARYVTPLTSLTNRDLFRSAADRKFTGQ